MLPEEGKQENLIHFSAFSQGKRKSEVLTNEGGWVVQFFSVSARVSGYLQNAGRRVVMSKEKDSLGQPGYSVLRMFITNEITGERFERFQVELVRVHADPVPNQAQLELEADLVATALHPFACFLLRDLLDEEETDDLCVERERKEEKKKSRRHASPSVSSLLSPFLCQS